MEAGILLEWVKQPGDRLAKGDVIAVVETQKGAIEIECFDEGVLSDLVAEPGAEVAVGDGQRQQCLEALALYGLDEDHG